MTPAVPDDQKLRPYGLTATLLTLRIATASVWILFGLVFKVLNVVPRHEAIVATVLGSAVAGPVTLLIGLAETAMGIWILSRWRPRTCATVQTIAIVSMNALELTLARDQLLAPLPMVCANSAFLAVGWYLTLHTHGCSANNPNDRTQSPRGPE